MNGLGSVLLLLADWRLGERIRLSLRQLGIPASCGDAAHAAGPQVAEARPALLILEANSPAGRSGADVALSLREMHPELRVVLYGGADGGANGGVTRKALLAGIRDAIPAQSDPAGEIIAVIQRELNHSGPVVVAGKTTLSVVALTLEAGLLVSDAQGRLIEVNDLAAQLLGWKPTGLIGTRLQSLYTPPPEMRTRAVLSSTADLHPSRPSSLDGAALRKADGTPLLIEGTLLPASSAEPQGGGALLFRAAATGGIALRLSEANALARQLLDQSPDPVIRTDSAGRIMFANDSAARLLGWDAAQLNGRLFNELVAADPERAPLNNRISQVMRAVMGSPTELAMRHRDGSLRYVDWSFQPLPDAEGKSGGGLASGYDTTRRRIAEQELMESEARYRRLLDAALEGIMVVGAGHGMVLDANPSLFTMLGVEREDCIGKLLWEIPPFASIFTDPDSIVRLAAHKTAQCEELQLDLGGGNTRFVEFSSQAYDDQGESLIRCNLHDISSLKKEAVRNAELYRDLHDACTLLRATQDQMVAQERLRALGTMASGIAHDLNNALAPVIGFTELLLEDSALLDGRAEARHYLELIRTGANDGAAVVARLREFYRHRDTGESLGELDLNDAVRGAVELTAPRWRSIAMANGVKLDIRSELCAEPRILGSAAELRELLANLILNAADAMPQGGEIGLITEILADGRISLEVRDSGSGMSAEVKARCMEPFFTTKGLKGTGLGLAMAYGIAQRHGALIEIESLPGHGTSITTIFPAFRPLAAAPDAASDISPPLRILVADDDAAGRELLSAYLRADGHAVSLAQDGEEAFALCRPGHFDLVISDRAMPRMSGLKLAEELRRQPGAPPLLLLSGYRELGADGSLPPGVDALLGKPVTHRRLRQAIAQFCPVRVPAGQIPHSAEAPSSGTN